MAKKTNPPLLAELAINYVESREGRAGASETCANEITRNFRVTALRTVK